MRRSLGRPLLHLLFLGSCLGQSPQVGRTIISVKHPVDSLGETVYERQGSDQLDRPVVPGVLIDPAPLHNPAPKYSRALRTKKFEGTATITGVISAQGKVIDLETDPKDDAEAARCALASVQQYRFKPPLLDGKPVAEHFRVVVQFAMKKP